MVKLMEIHEEQDRKRRKRKNSDDIVPVIYPGTMPDGEPSDPELIEVIPFGWSSHLAFLKSLGGDPQLRETDNLPFITDQGNYIIDCDFGPIDDLSMLSNTLNNRTGIVAHGLFLGLATDLITGTPTGIEHKTRSS